MISWRCEITKRYSDCRCCGTRITQGNPRLKVSWNDGRFTKVITMCERCAINLFKSKLWDLKEKIKKTKQTKQESYVADEIGMLFLNQGWLR